MEKILTLLTLGKKAYSSWLLHRLLMGLIVIIGLAIIIAMLISSTLIGGLVVAYYAMLNSGIEPQTAILYTGLFSLLLIIFFIICMHLCLNNFRKMSKTLVKPSPLTSSALGIVDSFADGFMKK